MHGEDDGEKTVFGQKLPTPEPADQGQNKNPPAGPPAGEKTVFGVQNPPPPQSPPHAPPHAAPPPQQPPYGQPAPPPPQQPPYNPPAQQHGPGRAAPVGPSQQPPHEDTWLGGPLNPFPSQPQQQPQYQTPPQPNYGQEPIYQPHHVPAGGNMFPEVQRDPQPQPQQITPRISFSDALKGSGVGAGGSSNPLVAAAANLLILLGRLRTGLVELQSDPLMEHVAREIDLFERNATEAGINPQDIVDAKYALAATADDIVQNLPNADRGMWLQYSMVARFFGERESGVGFFRKMDQAMQAPAQRFNLLELMLTCLSLGFEGQYRTARNGPIELARIRTAIYETLRRVRPRPDDDISVSWMAVPLGIKRRFGRTPLWVIAAVAGAMVVALFAVLSTLLARDGAKVQQEVLALHDGLPPIVIERTAPVVEAYAAPSSTQLQRVRDALTSEIENGLVVVDQTNQYIFVRVGEALQFRSGKADLQNDFSDLAQAIASALNPEAGPIRIVGYTDSLPLSGRGRYKTNEDLSLARAQTVMSIISPLLDDADRVETEGLGPVNPVASNDTREGRALNRRVEVMIQRESAL